jgi:hypothetical protein
MRKLWIAFAATGLAGIIAGCGPRLAGVGDEDGDDDTTGSDSVGTSATSATTATTASTTDGPPECMDASDCEDHMICVDGMCIDDTPEQGPAKFDLLFVIDNSGTMGEAQRRLGEQMPEFMEMMLDVMDNEGQPIDPDVQVMFTTTDMGHPACTPFQPDGYEPAQGAPTTEACIDRLSDFVGLGNNPPIAEDACTDLCPVAIKPLDPYVAFGPEGTNVPGDNVEGALKCLLPQGVNGCGYEAQLESMLQAINPAADWNQGNRPFLRDDATLGIVMLTDEYDCSVNPPEGYQWFTDPMYDTYWEVNPNTGTKTQATSAVCWNSSVECGQPDQNGVYADCNPVDNGILQPVDRYTNYLVDYLQDSGKNVVMLTLVGVPEVFEHSHEPPFQPIAGGIDALVYRRWRDGAWPAGDILPGDDQTAAEKEWMHGIAPGCIGEDTMGGFFTQAMPPCRISEVCQALDGEEPWDVRCCMESICDADATDAMRCLAYAMRNAAGLGYSNEDG